LPQWARDLEWWRHPSGYRGDPDFVVHPTHKDLGWTRRGLADRAQHLRLSRPIPEVAPVLTSKRRILNTECDCLIQTPMRLIVVECKDKTGFSSEQRERQGHLFGCLERLLPRPQPVAYVEVASAHARSPAALTLTWEQIAGVMSGA
jgi:hypothetical protein